MYKVIWIEDEPEKLSDLIDLASTYKIELEQFGTSKEGLEALEANIIAYDAVILDAKVHKDSNDERASVGGLSNSVHRLKELKSRKVIPFVIFTGQPDLQSDSSFQDTYHDVDIYVKARDNIRLLKELVIKIKHQSITQIKYTYRDVFAALDKHIPQQTPLMLTILHSIHNPQDNLDHVTYLPQLRRIVEDLFRKANEFGLLHDKCIDNGKVNLNQSSLFLSGKEATIKRVKCSKSHFSPLIQNSVRQIIYVTNAAAHTENTEDQKSLNLVSHRKMENTPFLLYSLTFQLCAIIIWFDNYVKANDDIDENKSLWVETNSTDESKLHEFNGWIPGEVSEIQNNGFGTFISDDNIGTAGIRPQDLKKHSLTIGSRIEIKAKSPDGVKTHISDIRKR